MKKYKNPPIARMLCTLNFKRSDTNAWKSVYIGSIYEGVKKFFPKSEDRIRVDHTFDIARREVSIKKEKETFFLDETNRISVSISESKLEFSQESMYSGWEDNLPKIIKVLKDYLEVSKQPLLENVDLRYINKIFIPNSVVKASDYFNTYVNYKALQRNCSRFEIRLSLPYDDGSLNIILLPIPSSNEESLFVLDLCYRITNIKNGDIGEIEKQLDAAHTNIEDAFEKHFVARHRRAERVAPHERDACALERPLHDSVLTEIAVEQWKYRVDWQNLTVKHQSLTDGIDLSRMHRALCNLTWQSICRWREKPARRVNINRNFVVFFRVNQSEKVISAKHRHLFFITPTAKKESDAGKSFFFHKPPPQSLYGGFGFFVKAASAPPRAPCRRGRLLSRRTFGYPLQFCRAARLALRLSRRR